MNILVVGGGIASCHIIHALMRHTSDITFITDYSTSMNSSLMAGASLVPVHIRNNHIKRIAQDNFQCILQQYERLSDVLDTQFLFRKPLQIFSREDRHAEPVTIEDSYHLSTRLLLDSSMRHFEKNIKVHHETFDHNRCIIEQDSIEYNGVQYNKVIFCEGVHLIKNPFFNHLTLLENWGQTLTLDIDTLDRNHMYHLHHRLIPTENNLWWYGASQSWTYPEKSEQDMWIDAQLNHLKDRFDIMPQVISLNTHQRPTTPGQFPYIGRHIIHEHLYIFNGLGSRGMMHAAEYAEALALAVIRNSDFVTGYDNARMKKIQLKSRLSQ